ncbi:AGAP010446-PA, partial [Anopheles gambiae str. PEST]
VSDYYIVMMAPSPSKSSKTQHPSFLITTDSVGTSPVPSSPPSTDAPKSQCSSLSDGESFECYGDNDISISETGGVDLELAPHLNSTTVGIVMFNKCMSYFFVLCLCWYNSESNGNPSAASNSGITRHSWSRTSLRGAPKRFV